MEPTGSFLRLIRQSPKGAPGRAPRTLLDDEDDGYDAPVRGPLFPRSVFHALLAVFIAAMMLTADWFGLLLLNSEGVVLQMGALNVLRVTAALMGGIAVPSVLMMIHYRRIYSYTSDGNVFFATTFALSFMMGLPCALVGIFG